MADTAGQRGEAARNRLLSELPQRVMAELRSKLSAVPLAPGHVLHERNLPITHVYFPHSGWVSLVVGFDDGFHVETGLVGCEGMTGLCLLHGVDTEIADAVVQAPGHALRMQAGDLRRAVDAFPDVRRVLLAYSDAMRAQAIQTAACNGHHSLQQRLARWLLMMDDRAQAGELPVTQEHLARILSVHRPSVTVAAGRLQRAGLIRYAGGLVTIVDRAGLKNVACECYRATSERYAFSCR